MNFFRLRGSTALETCSAETVVPRMTNRSTPAATTVSYSSWVRCGVREPATVTPASRISARRCLMSSGLIDSEYSCCIRTVARSAGSAAISSSMGCGFSYRVHRPSRSSTPRPPSLPSMIAVVGLTTESIGAPITGVSNENASMLQAVETSSGLRVRRDGTTAMSSNVYARRARLPRPISMSMLTRPAYPALPMLTDWCGGNQRRAEAVDVAVIGGGAMGLAAAWALTRRGARPVVFERFERGHTRGASHGATRNFNDAYAEEHYLDLL